MTLDELDEELALNTDQQDLDYQAARVQGLLLRMCEEHCWKPEDFCRLGGPVKLDPRGDLRVLTEGPNLPQDLMLLARCFLVAGYIKS